MQGGIQTGFGQRSDFAPCIRADLTAGRPVIAVSSREETGACMSKKSGKEDQCPSADPSASVRMSLGDLHD